MKKIGIILLLFHLMNVDANAQDIPQITEQKLENLTDAEQAETEDDSYL